MKTLNNLTFNFNLRQPKGKRETPLYLVVKVDGKQLKIATNIKVLPFLWNKRKQHIEVSPQLNEVERGKIMQFNSVIFDLKAQCNEVFNYLCSADVENVESFIKDTIKIEDMANYKAIPPKRTVTASKLLKRAFELFYTTQKETTIYLQKQNLEFFIKYCKEVGDSLNRLTQKGINEYQEYLLDMVQKGERKLSAKSINDRCMVVVRLVNNILTIKSEFSRYNIQQVRYINIKDKRTRDDNKRRALTNEEIKAINDVKGLTAIEQEVRDLFIVEINSGVRVSDLFKLFRGEYVKEVRNGKTIFTIKTEKRGITASVFVNDTIKAILAKYQNGFYEIVKIKENTFIKNRYNEFIKSIAHKAELNEIIEYYDDVAGRKIAKQAKLCEILTSHWARHTFITHKIIEGYTPKEISQMTGHNDTTMIERIYTHLTASDKAKNVAKAVERVEGKQDKTAITSDDDNKIIAEQARENYKLKKQATEQARENFNLKIENDIKEFFNNANKKLYHLGFHILRPNEKSILLHRSSTPNEVNAILLGSFPNDDEKSKIMNGASVIEVVNERLKPFGVKYNSRLRIVKIDD